MLGPGDRIVELRPIGFVRSEHRERKGMPPWGVAAAVELRKEFAPGLLHLEKHSHVWVLAWLESAERDLLRVTPRGVADTGPGGLHGVFAVRSPVRPNPIGLTAAKILGIEGATIRLDRLDFVDGTPVIDIKPYFASRDLIFSAVNRQIGKPSSREALRESLWIQALNFSGTPSGDLALGVRIVEHYRAEVLDFVEPGEWRITVPRRRPGVIDAVMGTARVTFETGRLTFTRREAVRFRHESTAFDYELVATSDNHAPVILAAPDSDLFEFDTFGL
jgi:tRNA-Thr(GGU) m(6)t(6)A37 methyltransferase TsaA